MTGSRVRDIATAKCSRSATDLHAALSGRATESSTMRCRKKLYDALSVRTYGMRIVTTCALVLAAPALAQQSPSAPRPKDAEKRPYKSKYRVIDVHVHGGAPREEVVAVQLEVMDRAGIA